MFIYVMKPDHDRHFSKEGGLHITNQEDAASWFHSSIVIEVEMETGVATVVKDGKLPIYNATELPDDLAGLSD